MKKPCLMWSIGPRVHGGKEICGRFALRGWVCTRDGSNDKIPICETCIINLGYDKKLLVPLR